MFRKLVSNLAFSPALVGQLGFYANRLRKEEATRRVGLVFTALALIIQSFAVFSPPEAVNASNPSNFIQGGVSSLDDFMRHYDANHNNIKDLLTTVGITRANLLATKKGEINSKDVYSWGLTSRFSAAQGERSYAISTANGGSRTFYYRPLSLWDTGNNIKTGSYYPAFIGKMNNGTYFAIQQNCANLILKTEPPVIPKPVYSCDSLQYSKISRLEYQFYTNATAKDGAASHSYTYNFGDGTSTTGNSLVRHTYQRAGTYTVTSTFKVTVAGGVAIAPGNCSVTFTVGAEMCPIPGKTHLPATSPECRPDPIAACEGLKITKLINTYNLQTNASVANGATITGYVYTIKKDGKVVKTITLSSKDLVNTTSYSTTEQGQYTVEVVVKTSQGDKTSPDCIKTFNIPAPQMCPQNPRLPLSSPECQPCPDEPTLWLKDEKCAASIVQTKTVKNMTQGNVDATTTTALAADKLIYTLSIENKGKASAEVAITEKLDDVVEYATLLDNGGGSYDSDSKILTWPATTLKAGEKQSRVFTIQILHKIPSMGTGTSDRTSYDCKIINTFGNAVEVIVNCPIEKKIVEQTVAELPKTGPGENMFFAGALITVVSYFYARARQVKKEVRLIRRDFNTGTI